MGAKGDLGIDLDLDKVPCREEGMTAYEMMLSESQERMLMVLHPELEAQAKAIFVKWGLDFAVIGYTTDTLRFVVRHQGEVMADLPIKELGDMAPEYDRPWVRRPAPAPLPADQVPAPADLAATLLDLVGSPDLASRRWVWEQYDHLIQGNTAIRPGGDAGVIRVDGTNKGLAMSVDVTPRYCRADPVQGGAQAVAEAWRNLSAVGATPIALTDNLNFGNPERPEIMGEFVGCIEGIGAAARALDFPIVSGNVSLYNETLGEAILPTPAIGGVGLLDDVDVALGIAFKAAGETVLLVGGHGDHLGQSIYLRDVLGREDGAPPPSISPSRSATANSSAASSARAASPPATTSRTAASRSRSPKWRWPAESAPASPCPAPPTSPSSPRIRPAMWSRPAPIRPRRSRRMPRKPAFRSFGSAKPAARR